ncbi:MAG: hypothetical protein DWI57_05715 [Chloroflexi bacterium]|nr:MAG: hypothetical protein DWI57_05715 [Chloroflexota bacterium]
MKLGPTGRRTYETRSAAAGRAASQPQARQRRRAQRTQRFAQQWSGMQSAISSRVRLPRLAWDGWRFHPDLPGFSGFRFAKLLSLALLVGVITLFVWFSDNDSFFVYQENVEFTGTTFVSAEELYTLCDVEAWSILWLQPELIRAQVLAHPYVADARVSVHWPARVQVAVTQVTPVAVWATEGAEFWLLADGQALPVRPGGAMPDLRIVDPQREARTPGSVERIGAGLLNTALRLQREFDLNEFRFNASIGLNFGLPETQTWVYWGDGTEFEAKQLALSAASDEIQANPNEARTLSLIAPNRPYFR